MGARHAVPDLILGLAEKLRWEDLRLFVLSLERTSFEGDVRLFVADVDPSTRLQLESHGVRLHPYRRVYVPRKGKKVRLFDPPYRRLGTARIPPRLPGLIDTLSRPWADRTDGRARLLGPLSIPFVSRYCHFYRFLRRNETRYARVMLTDVRDVFFQRNPFDIDTGEGLYSFLEYEGETLGSNWFNRGWLLSAYGEHVVNKLHDRPVSCAGITIGASSRVLEYLRIMVDELAQLSQQPPGIDQGVHNYVVNERLSDVTFVRNGERGLVTLALVPTTEVARMLPDGYADMRVLHQYDRHPRLAEILSRQIAAVPVYDGSSITERTG